MEHILCEVNPSGLRLFSWVHRASEQFLCAVRCAALGMCSLRGVLHRAWNLFCARSTRLDLDYLIGSTTHMSSFSARCVAPRWESILCAVNPSGLRLFNWVHRAYEQFLCAVCCAPRLESILCAVYLSHLNNY